MNAVRKLGSEPAKGYTTTGIDMKLSLTAEYKPYVVLDITTMEVDLGTDEKIGPEVHNVFYLNDKQVRALHELLRETVGPNDQGLDKYGASGKPE